MSPIGNTAPEAVSVKFAAKLLEVNELTIRGWIRQGRLPALRLGPKYVRIESTHLRILIMLRKEAEKEMIPDLRWGTILWRSRQYFQAS